MPQSNMKAQDQVSGIGSGGLKHKGRWILLAALAAGLILIYGKSDGQSLKGTLLSWKENIENTVARTLFPTAFLDENVFWPDDRKLAEHIMELVTHMLFTQDFSSDPLKEETASSAEEYYPSQELLDKFAEENREQQSQDTQEVLVQADQDSHQDIQDTSGGEDGEDPAQDTEQMAQGADQELIPAVATPANGVLYPTQSLYDYTFLINNFYITDSSTSSDASLIDGETLLNRDLTLDLTGEDPVILIYHTHSQEKFADSRDGEVYDTVVGLGNTLTEILQEKYHISVYHDTGVYDMINGVEDRNEAYSLAGEAVSGILAENPSIKVVIDLHRDGVAEDTHLVTQVNGKPTAQIMFFNGLCRNANNDTDGYLQNPYLTDNLAFSLQMQIKAAEKFPGFTRRIYLRDYRYNMHLCPRSLLVECGAQTNTVEEAQNAMEPLADLLYCVLSGQ